MTAPQPPHSNAFPPPPTQSDDDSGLNPAILAGSAYLGLGFCLLPTLAIAIWQWDNKPVRFHALQALAYFALTLLVWTVFGPLAQLQLMVFGDLFGGIFSLITFTVLFIGFFIYWVILTYRAYTGHEPKIPVLEKLITDKLMN